MITLNILNSLSEKEAYTHLEKCCVSKTWISKMAESRPFSSEEDVIKKAASIWYNDCSLDDFKQAFTGHPKIGDVDSLREKFANTKEWANNEQAKVAEANALTIEALVKANKAYKDKFGYIFIVSASNKCAEEILAIINTRLYHNKEDEIFVAMNEQHKITVIRLDKLIEGLLVTAEISSHITTHALDTSTGTPANKMLITLKGLRGNEWKPMSVGITNNDGRISDVLPPGRLLIPGNYMMTFNTAKYYEAHKQNGFYHEVSIQFTVADNSHYHIPLLINPFGYTTYRGS
ncbi:2-oxo-4-hydroxy-4-carboxy-5-ureidoimidazoline decarboxylase [Flavobacteriaceae bacterium AH-315-B10]|nr:2-oxo-4-hydroxy-4-carboxy-5-ureidoimidazoline decarboxylase [Flavobacteriaceae bacterium AH-315-B10]